MSNILMSNPLGALLTAPLCRLNWIQNVIRSEPTFANFQTFVLKMAHSAISKFGVNFVPDEDVTRHLLRAMWISTAVAFDSPDIQRKLAGKFVVSVCPQRLADRGKFDATHSCPCFLSLVPYHRYQRRQGAPLDSYLRSAVLESAVKLNVPTRLPTSGADSPGPGSDEYGMPPSESAVQWMLLRSLRKQAFEHPQCLRAAAATRDSAQVDYILNFAIEVICLTTTTHLTHKPWEIFPRGEYQQLWLEAMMRSALILM